MLDRYNFTLFDENDFYNIIGEQLEDKLRDRGIDNYTTYFITYASVLIQSHIREYTSLNIYKEYEDSMPNDYKLRLALSKKLYPRAIVGRKYNEQNILKLNNINYIVSDGLIDSTYWLTINDVLQGKVYPDTNKIILNNGDEYDYTIDDDNNWIVFIEEHYRYNFEVRLTEEQIDAIKLACVYQADYIIDNGSTERMTAMGMVNRSNKYDKMDLHEFEVCSVSHNILATAGLLYQGIGGGVYAKFK